MSTTITQGLSQIPRGAPRVADYEVGYGKPRFQAGASGNPKGRPKRGPVAFAETIEKVLNAKIEYRKRGRTKVATAQELSLKMLVAAP